MILLCQLNSRLHNDETWILTNVYGPCIPDRKRVFVDWMKEIHIPDNVDWMILGDFKLMRKPENRNKPGGNLSEMFMFNDAVTSLGLNEIEHQGNSPGPIYSPDPCLKS